MRHKKNQVLLPVILFGGVILLTILGLALSQNVRRSKIANPGSYSNQDEIPRVTAGEAFQALTDGEAVLVDTRSESEYLEGHISGAINIPVNQVESFLGELDPNTWYITYCT